VTREKEFNYNYTFIRLTVNSVRMNCRQLHLLKDNQTTWKHSSRL